MNRILSTGERASATPASAPPWTIRTSPSGSPARASTRAMCSRREARARSSACTRRRCRRAARPRSAPAAARTARCPRRSRRPRRRAHTRCARALPATSSVHRRPACPPAAWPPSSAIQMRASIACEQLERRDLSARPSLFARKRLPAAPRSRRSPTAPSCACSVRGPARAAEPTAAATLRDILHDLVDPLRRARARRCRAASPVAGSRTSSQEGNSRLWPARRSSAWPIIAARARSPARTSRTSRRRCARWRLPSSGS